MAVVGVLITTQAAAQVTFYEREGFRGRSFTTAEEVRNMERRGFNDRASSVVVERDRWEVCEDARFSGQCVVLRRGRYPSLGAMGLNDRISSARSVDRNAHVDDDRYAPVPVAPNDNNRVAQITFYEREGFRGRSFSTKEQIRNFERSGFNDRASSVTVSSGRWEVCEDVRFSGRCVVLRPGRYPSLAAMGLNDRVSSVRTVSRNARIDDHRYAPAAVVSHDYRRRSDERLFEADVTAVRAVVGPPEQRCWVEREEVVQDRSNANVPGAIAGAVIGGILGHQIGDGAGRDLATAGGAVAGAVVGANVGRDDGGQQAYTQDVRRCESTPSQARPEYWDVTYTFRGQAYRVQMTAPPGRTVTVNERGEPRE
nr:beta/gamma crystallin-related protein [Aromatoleum diolicum]